MEFITGLITGYLLSPITLSILILLGILNDSWNNRGLSAFLGIVAGLIAVKMFPVPEVWYWVSLVTYPFIGLVWGIWRYSRHVNRQVEQVKHATETVRIRTIKETHPTKMLPQITSWVLFWPFSLVSNAIGDFVKIIQLAITNFFGRIYKDIHTKATFGLAHKDSDETM